MVITDPNNPAGGVPVGAENLAVAPSQHLARIGKEGVAAKEELRKGAAHPVLISEQLD
jgi:hypothetical protein